MTPEDDWALTTESVNPEDPLIAGPRWRCERDEALAEAERLGKALRERHAEVERLREALDRALDAMHTPAEAVAILREALDA